MKRLLKFKTKVLYILGVFLLIWGVQLLFSYSAGFRRFYFSVFYPLLSSFLRQITGWFPFSIGDILYVAGGAWLLIGIYYFVKKLILFKKHPFEWLGMVLRFVMIVLTVYFAFLFLWGFNYRYDRLKTDFGISRTTFSDAGLEELCDTLVDRINGLHREIVGDDASPAHITFDYRKIKKQAVLDYERMGIEDSIFHYYPESIKPSMFGNLMNYAGITGYYNPFTGEAQVNTTPPPVALPFTVCHEMAHQLGFAAEDDANFISYLVTSSSSNTFFRYSANFSLFIYAANALSYRNPEQADSLWHKALKPGVRKDFTHYFAFYQQFRTPVKPILDQAYDQYLRANEQELGIDSYRGVVALILDYKKKEGRLPGVHKDFENKIGL